MCFWLCSGILPKTRRAIPGGHFIITRGPCASMSQEITMREQSRNAHPLPVLDQQTVSMLMCQTLARQEVELLQWQIQEMSDWTGAATSGVYRVAGTGRDQDREGGGSGVLKVLCQATVREAPAGRSQAHVLYLERGALVYQSDLLDYLP